MVDDLDEFIIRVDKPVVVPIATGARQKFVDGNEGRRRGRQGRLGRRAFWGYRWGGGWVAA